jgi:hypothetical protein
LLQALRQHVAAQLAEKSVATPSGKEWVRGYDDWQNPELSHSETVAENK